MPSGNCSRCRTFRRWLHKHRLKPGVEGGKYEDGNVDLVCANCHEDVHEGPMGGKLRYRKPSKRPSREVMEDGYVVRRLSVRVLAAELKTAPSNVDLWLRYYEIPRRPTGANLTPRQSGSPGYDVLYKRYVVGKETLEEIGADYGVSFATVGRWMDAEKIARRNRSEAQLHPRPPRDELAAAVEESTQIELAEHYGVSVATISKWQADYGITGPRRSGRPRKRPPDAELLALRAEGLTQAKIGERYGVSQAAVQRWLKDIASQS